MNEPMPPESSSQVDQSASADFSVNMGSQDLIRLFSPTGYESYVHSEDADYYIRELGFKDTQWDLDACKEEWNVIHAAVADVVERAYTDLQNRSYQHEATMGAVYDSLGKLANASRQLMLAFGSSGPTEADVISIAEHMAEHPDDDYLFNMRPSLRRLIPLAQSYPQEVLDQRKEARIAKEAEEHPNE